LYIYDPIQKITSRQKSNNTRRRTLPLPFKVKVHYLYVPVIRQVAA